MLTLARAGHAAVLCCSASSLVWLWTEPLCRPGRRRARGDRARQSAVVSGAFRARDDRRAVRRDLCRALFSLFCCGWNAPPRRAGCCSAPPSRSRSAPSCRPCFSCRRRAARCCSIAGLCDRRNWQPAAACSRPGAALLAALGAFLLTVWVVYGCNADPFYGIATLARGIAELAAFADAGEPSFFLGQYQPARQPGVLPGTDPGQVADAVPDRGRDRRGGAAPLASPGLAAHGAAGRAPRRSIASVIPSTINIGLRHILPAFPLLAIVAAIGLGRLLARSRCSPRRAARGRAAAGLASRRGGCRGAGLPGVFQPARARRTAAHRDRTRISTGVRTSIAWPRR